MKPASKKERALLLLLQRPQGVTENEILRLCSLSSGRNYPNEAERRSGFEFERIKEKNPDGIGFHYRYKINDYRLVNWLLMEVQIKRKRRGAKPLSEVEVTKLLAPYSHLN